MKIDLTLRNHKFIIALLITFVVAILSFHAISQMIFGVLGRTWEDPAWPYTVALFMSLLANSIALAIGQLTAKTSLTSKIALSVSAAMSGACMGIYYGGLLAGDRNPPIGGIVAVIIAVLMVIASFDGRKRLTRIAIIVMGIVATYGIAFLGASAAFAFLSANNFLWGSMWGLFCLGAIALTMRSIDLLCREIADYSRTNRSGYRL